MTAKPFETEMRRLRANSVYRALTAVGDRWSLLILGAAFEGCVRFRDWTNTIGISSNILTNRLGKLVELGCLERRRGEDARGYEYHLTAMGTDLYPTALMFWRFDQLWSENPALHPEVLVHRTCGQAMMPALVCGGCGREIRARDVSYRDGPGAGFEPAPPPRVSRRSSVTLEDTAGRLFRDSVDYVGDRWTQMVIASIFMGASRFDDIQRECGIATNILADRLKSLAESDVLQRRRYQTRPDRFEYVLTPKGLDTYPIALTLMNWGDRWLAAPSGKPLLLRHEPCGSDLEPRLICDSCRETPDPHDVSFGSGSDL